MNNAPTLAPTFANEAERTAHNQRVLDLFVAQAADLATHIHKYAITPPNNAEGTAPVSPTPLQLTLYNNDPTLAFDRMARIGRRCIVLSRYLATPIGTRAPEIDRTTARAQLIRGVEDAIAQNVSRAAAMGIPKTATKATDGPGAPGRETSFAAELREELDMRLDDPDFEFDLQNRSIEDLITEISRDLGVPIRGRIATWQRRTPADVASLRARAAAPPKSPLHVIRGGNPTPKSPIHPQTAPAPHARRTQG